MLFPLFTLLVVYLLRFSNGLPMGGDLVRGLGMFTNRVLESLRLSSKPLTDYRTRRRTRRRYPACLGQRPHCILLQLPVVVTSALDQYS